MGISPIFQQLIIANIANNLDECMDQSTPNYFVTCQAKLSQVMTVDEFTTFVKDFKWQQKLLKVMEKVLFIF